MNWLSLVVAIFSNLKYVIELVEHLSNKSPKEKETIRLLIQDAIKKASEGDTSDVEKVISDL